MRRYQSNTHDKAADPSSFCVPTVESQKRRLSTAEAHSMISTLAIQSTHVANATAFYDRRSIAIQVGVLASFRSLDNFERGLAMDYEPAS